MLQTLLIFLGIASSVVLSSFSRSIETLTVFQTTLNVEDSIDISLSFDDSEFHLASLHYNSHVTVQRYSQGNLQGLNSFELPVLSGMANYESMKMDQEMIVVGGQNSIRSFSSSQDSWLQLPSLEGGDDTRFGHSVAVSGGTLMSSQLSTGSILVYSLIEGDWILTQELTDHSTSFVGFALAVNDNLALVGAPRKDMVYCYQRHSDGMWRFHSTVSSVGRDRDYFGQSIAMDSRFAVISGDSSTHLYKWVADGWVYQNPVVGVTKSIFAATLANNLLMILTTPTTIDVYSLNSDDE